MKNNLTFDLKSLKMRTEVYEFGPVLIFNGPIKVSCQKFARCVCLFERNKIRYSILSFGKK